MNIHFETPRDRFRHLKREVLKIYPDAKTNHNADGSFSVLDTGVNPIDDRYPDLQTASTIHEAWHNVKTVEYWQRIEDRNNKGFAADKANIQVNDFIEDQPLVEENIYESEKED